MNPRVRYYITVFISFKVTFWLMYFFVLPHFMPHVHYLLPRH
jgi:hypothetical protein